MTLAERYRAVRAATEALAEPLSPEDQLLQSMPDASPTKWHRAHTTWFFEEFVLGKRGFSPVDPSYRFLFNSYYESVGPRHARPRRGMLSRPSHEAIAEYRRRVDGRMLEVIDEDAETAAIVELGLAHEEQHQELILTDILHAFSQHPLLPAVRPAELRRSSEPRASVDGFAEHDGGLVTIGTNASGFSFDNERPAHRVFLEPFAIARRPINVGEVRAFIESGGYTTPSLWLSAGFDHVRGRSAPHNLRLEGGKVIVFGVDGERVADEEEPAAHLDFYEADAIARSLGGRLPTEAEWEHAAGDDLGDANFWQDGLAGGALRPLRGGGFFGDVWEWTSSSYAPYPGFVAAPGAVGEYNGKFMVNQYVLRGGSCLSPRGHLRRTYRNFWPAGTSFQMTGARIVRDLGRR